MPGRKEQDPDECQRFFRVYVNELIHLWENGFTAYTPKHPQGRRVRVILICICCDKPAAHKLGGFGSHSHTFFCTRCWIKQTDKANPAAYKPGGTFMHRRRVLGQTDSHSGFPARTDEAHRAAGRAYAELNTTAGRDAFVKQKATRWTEFARLPNFFDLVRCIVVDPMHNLLLGIPQCPSVPFTVTHLLYRLGQKSLLSYLGPGQDSAEERRAISASSHT